MKKTLPLACEKLIHFQSDLLPVPCCDHASVVHNSKLFICGGYREVQNSEALKMHTIDSKLRVCQKREVSGINANDIHGILFVYRMG